MSDHSAKKRKKPLVAPESRAVDRLLAARKELEDAEKEVVQQVKNQVDRNFAIFRKTPSPLSLVSSAFNEFITDEQIEIESNLSYLLFGAEQNCRYGKAFSVTMKTKKGREYEYSLHVSNLRGPRSNYLSLTYFDKSTEEWAASTQKMRFSRDQMSDSNLAYTLPMIPMDGSQTKGFTASMLPLPDVILGLIIESFTEKKYKDDVTPEDEWGYYFGGLGNELWIAFQIVIFERAMQLVRLKLHSEYLFGGKKNIDNIRNTFQLIKECVGRTTEAER